MASQIPDFPPNPSTTTPLQQDSEDSPSHLMATRPSSRLNLSGTASSSHDPTTRDLITLSNLTLPHGLIAPDVWGSAKAQPAQLSLSLLLQNTFQCHDDKLDDSTIHYGQLAKAIRGASKEGQTAGEMSGHVEAAIQTLARKGDGKFVVARATVEVKLPKAAMFSDSGVSLINTTSYDEAGRTVGYARVFKVEGIKVMTLIGVNGYERSQKQPLVVSVVLHLRPEAETRESGQAVAVFNFEGLVVQIIQETSFETLEVLADFTITQLRKKMLDAVLPGTRVQLRIEKPRAVAFADAPAVEIVRDVPYSRDQSKRGTRVASSAMEKARASTPSGERSATPVVDSRASSRLSVIKPYTE